MRLAEGLVVFLTLLSATACRSVESPYQGYFQVINAEIIERSGPDAYDVRFDAEWIGEGTKPQPAECKVFITWEGDEPNQSSNYASARVTDSTRGLVRTVYLVKGKPTEVHGECLPESPGS